MAKSKKLTFEQIAYLEALVVNPDAVAPIEEKEWNKNRFYREQKQKVICEGVKALDKIMAETKTQNIVSGLTKNPSHSASMSLFHHLKSSLDESMSQAIMAENIEEALVKFSQPGTAPIEEILATQLLNLNITANHWLALSAIQKSIEAKEKYAGLALRAIETSRKIAATLADIKSPRKATFIKNALQVNNPPPQNSENFSVESRNKLITEGGTYAPLDLGSQTGTSSQDSDLETVGVLNRPQN